MKPLFSITLTILFSTCITQHIAASEAEYKTAAAAVFIPTESKSLATVIAKIRAINENAVVAQKKLRSSRLTSLLYDLLISLPMELIKIIASYDYFFEGNMYTVAINPYNNRDVERIKMIDNNSLLIRHVNGIIAIWNIHTGTCMIPKSPEELQRLARATPVSSLTPTPKPALTETTSDRATVDKLLWKHQPVCNYLHLSRQRVALGQAIPPETVAEPKIIISSTQTGKTLHTLSGHHGKITQFVELPEELLASGSDDHTIQVWDLKSGARLHVLQTIQPARYLAITQDGKLVTIFKRGSFQVFV